MKILIRHNNTYSFIESHSENSTIRDGAACRFDKIHTTVKWTIKITLKYRGLHYTVYTYRTKTWKLPERNNIAVFRGKLNRSVYGPTLLLLILFFLSFFFIYSQSISILSLSSCCLYITYVRFIQAVYYFFYTRIRETYCFFFRCLYNIYCILYSSYIYIYIKPVFFFFIKILQYSRHISIYIHKDDLTYNFYEEKKKM